MSQHLQLLACVARADGVVSVEEALALRSFMEASGMPPEAVAEVERLLDPAHEIDLDAVVQRLISGASAWTLAEAIRDAYVIAAADGEITKDEVRTVERIFDMLGLPHSDRAKLHTWARNAAHQQLLGMAFLTASLDQLAAARARRDELTRP